MSAIATTFNSLTDIRHVVMSVQPNPTIESFLSYQPGVRDCAVRGELLSGFSLTAPVPWPPRPNQTLFGDWSPSTPAKEEFAMDMVAKFLPLSKCAVHNVILEK